MIPSINDLLTTELEIETQPSKNYMMHFDKKYIVGTNDKQEAMKQVIFKILNTERYDYIIYSWNYGIELKDLYGEPLSYVCAEVQDRINEALCQDDRINEVTDFEFEYPERNVLLVKFKVHTIFGDVDAEREVTY